MSSQKGDCWKCTGTGRKYSKKTRLYDGDECGVCSGTGFYARRVEPDTLPPGVIPPCEGSDRVPGLTRQQEAPFDLLPQKGEIIAPFGCGWRIYQIARGHKLTSDDLVTANVCCEAIKSKFRKGVRRIRHIDLGCGCGSVLLAVARFARHIGMAIESFGVEAQEVSHHCCERGIFWNGIETTTRVDLHDLRTWKGPPPPSQSVEWVLLSGTPPYFAASSFVPSPGDIQKLPCRMLVRGQAIDYAIKATGLMRDASVPTDLVLVDASRNESIMDQWMSGHTSDWRQVRRVRVIPKTSKPPRFTIWQWKRSVDQAPAFDDTTLTIRDASNKYTPAYEKTLIDVGYKESYS